MLFMSQSKGRQALPDKWNRPSPFQWKNALPWHLGRQSSESSASKIVGRSGITVAFKTTFAAFTRASPDNSLERFTERSVGLVTD
jgi:hypothetical protein